MHFFKAEMKQIKDSLGGFEERQAAEAAHKQLKKFQKVG